MTERTAGIIGAMEDEVSTLIAAMTETGKTEIAGMKFVSGKLDGKKAVVVQCGMGKVNAGICAQTLISQFGVNAVINTGVAGSLSADINIGDIVISRDAVQHDYDVSAIGFAKGEIPYTGLYAFPADETLIAAAGQAVRTSAPGIGIFEGRICSGDQFIASKEQKKKITETFGGLCAEMEGAAVAQVCWLNKVPFVILRAISDKADDSEEVSFEIFAAKAAKVCADAVREMIQLI
jgi:adenosylhomocysteine nucleosidase